MRGLLGFAGGIGLDEFRVWEIYQAVAEQTEPSEARQGERLTDVPGRRLASVI